MQLSLRQLRSQGYRCEITEHFNHWSQRRQDLFGFVDILAVGNGHTLAVQTTTYSNVSARVKKIRQSDALSDLLACGWQISVHGWRKPKSRWICRIVEIENV